MTDVIAAVGLLAVQLGMYLLFIYITLELIAGHVRTFL